MVSVCAYSLGMKPRSDFVEEISSHRRERSEVRTNIRAWHRQPKYNAAYHGSKLQGFPLLTQNYIIYSKKIAVYCASWAWELLQNPS